MESLKELVNADTERFVKQSVPLVLGHLIRVTCARAGTPESEEQKKCFKTFAKQHVQEMYNKLESKTLKTCSFSTVYYYIYLLYYLV